MWYTSASWSRPTGNPNAEKRPRRAPAPPFRVWRGGASAFCGGAAGGRVLRRSVGDALRLAGGRGRRTVFCGACRCGSWGVRAGWVACASCERVFAREAFRLSAEDAVRDARRASCGRARRAMSCVLRCRSDGVLQGAQRGRGMSCGLDADAGRVRGVLRGAFRGIRLAGCRAVSCGQVRARSARRRRGWTWAFGPSFSEARCSCAARLRTRLRTGRRSKR